MRGSEMLLKWFLVQNLWSENLEISNIIIAIIEFLHMEEL
jgi:hypothetical protein